jgi:hypothetical protein
MMWTLSLVTVNPDKHASDSHNHREPVCFKDKRSNATIIGATDSVSEARRMTRLGGEHAAGEPIREGGDSWLVKTFVSV